MLVFLFFLLYAMVFVYSIENIIRYRSTTGFNSDCMYVSVK